MARNQTLVQLSDRLVAALDEVAARERRSRSDLIRAAIAAYLADTLHDDVDRQYVEAYTKHPPTDEFDAWASAALEDAITEEAW